MFGAGRKGQGGSEGGGIRIGGSESDGGDLVVERLTGKGNPDNGAIRAFRDTFAMAGRCDHGYISRQGGGALGEVRWTRLGGLWTATRTTGTTAAWWLR
jgi:hypothetical protein